MKVLTPPFFYQNERFCTLCCICFRGLKCCAEEDSPNFLETRRKRCSCKKQYLGKDEKCLKKSLVCEEITIDQRSGNCVKKCRFFVKTNKILKVSLQYYITISYRKVSPELSLLIRTWVGIEPLL